MAEMKDSDIRWIGQIPKKWKVIRVKDAFTRKKAKAKQENPVILSLARSGVKVRDITNNEGQLAENYSDYNPVMVDDLLLNPMDLISGDNCNISKIEGVISPAYVNLRYKKGINPEFYNFYFKYQYWCKAFFAYGKGVSFENRWTLNYDILERFPLILPSIEEQNRIVKFLKEKCAEIDALHTDIEKQIETLEEYKKSIITEAVTKGLDPDVEMKDSGIEWIGMIPKNWNVTRIGYESWIRARLGWKGLKAEEYVLEGHPFLSAFNIIQNKISWDELNYITNERYNESPEIMLKVGDIVLVKDGAGIGKCAKIDSLPYETATTNGSLAVISSTVEKLDYNYLYFYLQSAMFQNYILRIMNGMGVPHLSQEELRKIKIPFPPINEQIEIAKYLEKKRNDIDMAILEKIQQIETLEQYKKSVIYEYVTGKKEVQ